MVGRHHLRDLRIGFQHKAPFPCHRRAKTGSGTGLSSTPRTWYGHGSPELCRSHGTASPGCAQTQTWQQGHSVTYDRGNSCAMESSHLPRLPAALREGSWHPLASYAPAPAPRAPTSRCSTSSLVKCVASSLKGSPSCTSPGRFLAPRGHSIPAGGEGGVGRGPARTRAPTPAAPVARWLPQPCAARGRWLRALGWQQRRSFPLRQPQGSCSFTGRKTIWARK